MRVSPVWPKEDNSVKNRVNLSNHSLHTGRVNLQASTILLKIKSIHTCIYIKHHLRYPVFVKIIDDSDAPPILVRVVHMLHIVSSLPWIARHHGFRPAVNVVVTQGSIIGSLVWFNDDRVQNTEQVFQVRTRRTYTISPDNLVGTDGLFQWVDWSKLCILWKLFKT